MSDPAASCPSCGNPWERPGIVLSGCDPRGPDGDPCEDVFHTVTRDPAAVVRAALDALGQLSPRSPLRTEAIEALAVLEKQLQQAESRILSLIEGHDLQAFLARVAVMEQQLQQAESLARTHLEARMNWKAAFITEQARAVRAEEALRQIAHHWTERSPVDVAREALAAAGANDA